MMPAQLGHRRRVAPMDRAQQILGLVLELFEVGTNGKVTIVELTRGRGRTSFLGHARGPQQRAKRRFVRTLNWNFMQVDSVLSADGRRPLRRGQYTPCEYLPSLPPHCYP
jgi:hypothetical protein